MYFSPKLENMDLQFCQYLLGVYWFLDGFNTRKTNDCYLHAHLLLKLMLLFTKYTIGIYSVCALLWL